MAQSSVRSLKDDPKRIQGPTVKILVGMSKKPSHVHESILCSSSPFFKKAMSGPWKESAEHTIELPEDDPDMFDMYSHWLYYATIPVIVEGTASDESTKVLSQEYYDLAKAYVLGDKLLDVKFQNCVIDAIVERHATPDKRNGRCYIPNKKTINYAFDNTTESAPIRKLLVDMYMGNVTAEWLSKDLPPDFIFSVLKSVVEKTPVLSVLINASDYYMDPAMEKQSLKRKLSEIEL
ncbi:hypothetical protein N7517_009810 [Penicillium concentricum]|uniref:BTB domain-containing protein n=1 Tax=Penicillium concentricum TaxID=293559 RepID=A0A9W9RKM2_9EURO|nr:uncharacterized protein N7517_009810 [Penicillium concentricum]KAJ5360619.1 hypothetical protein N7517_009810 [Penicillium concentricum]